MFCFIGCVKEAEHHPSVRAWFHSNPFLSSSRRSEKCDAFTSFTSDTQTNLKEKLEACKEEETKQQTAEAFLERTFTNVRIHPLWQAYHLQRISQGLSSPAALTLQKHLQLSPPPPPPPPPLVFYRSIRDAALCWAICSFTVLGKNKILSSYTHTPPRSLDLALITSRTSAKSRVSVLLKSTHLDTDTIPRSGNKLISADFLVHSANRLSPQMSDLFE